MNSRPGGKGTRLKGPVAGLLHYLLCTVCFHLDSGVKGKLDKTADECQPVDPPGGLDPLPLSWHRVVRFRRIAVMGRSQTARLRLSGWDSILVPLCQGTACNRR